MKASLKKDILNRIPEIKKLTERGRLIRAIIETIVELKRFPNERDLKSMNDMRENFPHIKLFETLGNQEETINAVKDFCKQFHLKEIIPFCSVDKVRNSLSGVVYLYKAKTSYKIGRSNNVERRDKEIKLQLPFKVELIHTIETFDTIKSEKYWHDYFKSKRLNGEWFRLSEEDVVFFKSKASM